MTLVRIAISAFILVLIALSGMGWVWTGAHQRFPQVLASRAVLALGALAAAAGLAAIWRRSRPA